MACNCSSGASASGKVDFQYAAKVVCGPVKEGGSLPPGDYKTKINIHNPSRCDCVTFRWKVAVGFPHLKIGPISEFAEATLCPDEALEIDGSDIFRQLGGHMPAHIEGWLVVETPAELDVVAVYGSAATQGGAVNAFHTERVQPRCLPVCEDFSLDASTGVSLWEVAGPYPGQAPAGAPFAQAVLGQPAGANFPDLPGALWIHPPGANTQPEGVYTYRLRFKLCSGFRDASLEGSLFADYFANAFLNGHAVSPTQTNGPNYPGAVAVQATTHFKAGTNELIVLVTNKEKGTTGLALNGEIEVANGLCPGDGLPLLKCPGVTYDVYTRHFTLQNSGNDWWGPDGPVSNGARAGTTNQNRRVEALWIQLSGAIPPGMSIEYQVHQQNNGWLPTPTTWYPAGAVAGTAGFTFPDLPKRLEAVRIRLVNAPLNCHVHYMVHTAKKWGANGGDSAWFSDGAMAGTTGQNRRLEAIWVVIS